MQFVGVHLNFFNILKVNIGKFSAPWPQREFQNSKEPYRSETEQDKVFKIKFHNRALSTILTYNLKGIPNQMFQTKGIYVDCYA